METDGQQTTASTDTSITSGESSSVLDTYDFSLPNGGINADSDDGQEDDAASGVGSDDASQGDNAGEEISKEAGDAVDDSNDGDPDLSKMSEAERNNFFAQRRIAEQRVHREQDARLADDLRDKAIDFIDVDPDEQDLAEMDEVVAEQIRTLRRNERARLAESAIADAIKSRSEIRSSFEQAETTISLFNPASDAYNQTLHNMALSEWAVRYGEVVTDANGEPQLVGVKDGAPLPYEYLKEIAPRYESILRSERIRGQQTAAINQSRSERPSSSTYGNDAKASAQAALTNEVLDTPFTESSA